MEIIIMIVLLIINGLLSMAEIAIIASKKIKIQQLADKGNKQAVMVLNLLKDPNMLFSTIHVGITFIGILNGAFGAILFAEPLSTLFDLLGVPATVSDTIAFVTVVGIITYISIIVGELLPKRLALRAPETISLMMAQPMMIVSTLFRPGVLSLVRLSPQTESEMSIDEVRAVIKQGAKSGIFKSTEKNIVEKTLSLSELKVSAIMTPRNRITWVDIDSDIEILKQAVLKNQFSFYPVCKDTLDNVKGIINADALLGAFIADKKIDIHDLMYKPLLIPEHTKTLQVLELFKKNYIHMGIVIDDYGNVLGLVTVTDILEAIVGDFPTAHLNDNGI